MKKSLNLFFIVGVIAGIATLFEYAFAPAESAELQLVDVGSSANDGTGDTIRSAFVKVNTNFWDVWATRVIEINSNTGTNITVDASEVPADATTQFSGTNVQAILESIDTALTFSSNRVAISDASGNLATSSALLWDGTSLELQTDSGGIKPLVIKNSSGNEIAQVWSNVNGDGVIGVNNNAGSAKIWIDSNDEKIIIGAGSESYTDPALILKRSIDSSEGGSSHGYVDQTTVDSGFSYASFDVQLKVTGSGDYTGRHFAGFQSNGLYEGSGALDDWYSNTTTFTHNGLGTIDEYYGYKLADPLGTGAFNKKYGFYSGPVSGASTFNYQFFAAGSSGKSYLGGAVQVNDARETPLARFVAKGTSTSDSLLILKASDDDIVFEALITSGVPEFDFNDSSGNSSIVILPDDYLVAIGTNAPTYERTSFLSERTINNTVGGSTHSFTDNNSLDSGLSHSGFNFELATEGSEDFSDNHVVGFQSNGTHAGSSQLSYWRGFSSQFQNDGGHINTHASYYAGNPTGSGTYGSKYGFYSAITSGASTNNYQFFASGTTGKSYIGGSLLINDADETPDGRLVVKALGAGSKPIIAKNASGTEIVQIWNDGSSDGQIYVNDSAGTSNIVLDGSTGTARFADDITVQDQSSVKFEDADGSNYIELQSPSVVGSNITLTLPSVTSTLAHTITGTWTPGLEFGGASVGMTFGAQEGHYTIIGDTCYVSGAITLTAKGSSTGSAKITSLPATGKNVTAAQQVCTVGYAASMAGLTSAPTGLFGDNATTISLYDWGASGASGLDDTNFSDTSTIRFSGVFKVE